MPPLAALTERAAEDAVMLEAAASVGMDKAPVFAASQLLTNNAYLTCPAVVG